MWELQEAGTWVCAGPSGWEQHRRDSEHPATRAVPKPLAPDGSHAINREWSCGVTHRQGNALPCPPVGFRAQHRAGGRMQDAVGTTCEQRQGGTSRGAGMNPVGLWWRSEGASLSPDCYFVGTEEQDTEGEEQKTGRWVLQVHSQCSQYRAVKGAGRHPLVAQPCHIPAYQKQGGEGLELFCAS